MSKKKKSGGVPWVVINTHLQGLKRNKVHKAVHYKSDKYVYRLSALSAKHRIIKIKYSKI